MRFDTPVHLNAPVHALGEHAQPVADAVTGLLIDEENAERYAYTALRTSTHAPVELAARAAAESCTAAGTPPHRIAQLLHAWTYHQGHEFWSPAHYLAQRIGAVAAEPVGIQQMCNGGLAALVQAACRLLATGSGPALVTTADCFPQPGFDRWGGDYGVCYGDGATSVLVDRAPHGRSVRLLSAATVAAPVLEGMHRGDAPFSPAPTSGVKTLLPKLAKKEFLTAHPALPFGPIAHDAVTSVVTRALRDAGVGPDDGRLRAAALPRLARHVMADAYEPAFRAVCAAPVVRLGADTGHLGAGDAVANLSDLLDRDDVRPGDLLVLLSAGAGFTWSAAIVEVNQP
ncbi:ketoacyl-ACP synthase III family protein [Streptomyces sp. LP11]|uniref:Ketoacyl-ACP synthase III family protein n=1 Tax=Streptomyces pyxinicus TaxID=2970331 RepID=A0ABT2BB28_9ACTN|nr:ketoacyl-ACP synthase III family protein [Streptomyces sp. LP11]MCS0605726.1 ketoacyl-ACP synthase III family protein [Streptomyces sp. LP11]